MRFADPLAEPGEADLTAHVDFARLAAAAASCGAAVHGPVPQGDFLRALGIEARAGALRARASEAEAAAVDSALARLTDDAPRGDGRPVQGHGDLASAPDRPARLPPLDHDAF